MTGGGSAPYVRVDELVWSDEELQQGKLVKIRGFPKDKKVKLFRVTVSTNRTEFVATNDSSQASTDAVQDACGIRWKIVACFLQGGVSPRTEAVNWS